MTWLEFILQLVKEIMPLLTLVVTAIIAWQQVKAKQERRVLTDEVKRVAHSVNGMKGELVAAAAKGGFDEGAKLEAGRSASPEAEAKAVARSDELTEASRVAASNATKGCQ